MCLRADLACTHAHNCTASQGCAHRQAGPAGACAQESKARHAAGGDGLHILNNSQSLQLAVS